MCNTSSVCSCELPVVWVSVIYLCMLKIHSFSANCRAVWTWNKYSSSAQGAERKYVGSSHSELQAECLFLWIHSYSSFMSREWRRMLELRPGELEKAPRKLQPGTIGFVLHPGLTSTNKFIPLFELRGRSCCSSAIYASWVWGSRTAWTRFPENETL